MSRLFGMGCAAVLVLAVAGCTFDSFLALPTGASGQQQIVTGSVAQVSAILEEGLREAGIAILTKRVGSEIRLAGRTSSGKVFCLHLYGETRGRTEKTLVRIKWDGRADESFWQMVLQLLATPATGLDDSSTTSETGRPLRSE